MPNGAAVSSKGKTGLSFTRFCWDLPLTMDVGARESDLRQAYLLLDRGLFSELEIAAKRLTERYPGSGRAWHLLGASFLIRGYNLEAIVPLECASQLMPENGAIWDNLGVANFRAGKCDAAEVCFRRSLMLSPKRLETWVNASANALLAGKPNDAEYYAREALKFTPECAEAYLNLGNALARLGQGAKAIENYRHAVDVKPDLVDAYLSLGIALEQMGQVAEAMASYRKALKLDPDHSQAHSNLLFMITHDEYADPKAVFAEHRRFGERLEASLKTTWRPHANVPDPERRLKVGFVSGDYRKHAAASFIEPLWKQLDKGQIELFAYYNHHVEDEATVRLKPYADRWMKVFGMSDDALAEHIRADSIDILVDLSGHTAYNRLAVFARKPAPLQLSWLGYPGTTGLTAIDYRPLSCFAAPQGKLDAFFTEKLVYLPSTATAFQSNPNAPEVNELPALDRGYLTFASFNRPSKLGNRVIALWSRVLSALPSSRMLIASVDETELRANLIERFRHNGISPDRLDFHPRLPMVEYLALHHEVDIILDTFPYSGGTTSNHALSMGVPVLSLVGDRLSQRQGANIMGRIGLQEWVVESEDDYVERAVRAAGELRSLGALRAGLRDKLSDISSRRPDSVSRGIEAMFRVIWRRWCAGLPVESFELRL
jgi:predicted O-linked N-acetylglucosamine transferase (SPINDLY family)